MIRLIFKVFMLTRFAAVTSQDPTTIAANWANRLGQSTQKITDGVQAVTTPPGQAAARNQQGYIAGVQNNVGKWARNVAAVSLSDWQQAVINKGIPRVSTGAQAAQDKFASFMSKLLPAQKSLYGTLPPRGDTSANINRAVAWMQGMAKLRGTLT